MELGRPVPLADALLLGTGVPVKSEPTKGTLLVAGATYYFMEDASGAMVTSFGVKWDAAIIVTVSIEDTNMPDTIVSNYDGTAANGWVTELPAPFLISPAGTGVVTSGVLVVAGGNAGAATAHLPGLGSKRQRLKAVVGATGGYLAVAPHGKA